MALSTWFVSCIFMFFEKYYDTISIVDNQNTRYYIFKLIGQTLMDVPLSTIARSKEIASIFFFSQTSDQNSKKCFRIKCLQVAWCSNSIGCFNSSSIMWNTWLRSPIIFVPSKLFFRHSLTLFWPSIMATVTNSARIYCEWFYSNYLHGIEQKWNFCWINGKQMFQNRSPWNVSLSQ